MSHELTQVIGTDTLVHVEVEASPIVTVLSLMNEHIKKQSARIAELENQMKGLVPGDRYERERSEMLARVEKSETKTVEAVERVESLSKAIRTLEDKLNFTISERLADSLVTVKTQVRAAASGLECQIQAAIPDVSVLRDEIEKLKEVVSANASSLSAEFENLSKEVAILKTAPVAVEPVKDAETERSAGISQEQSSERLSVREDVEEGKPETLQTALVNLEESFDNHKENVVAAMGAIRDELQLIRDHGKGLAGLPPLNLANVVPSFFNNPSFRYKNQPTTDEYEEEEELSEDARLMRTKVPEVCRGDDNDEGIPLEEEDEEDSAPLASRRSSVRTAKMCSRRSERSSVRTERAHHEEEEQAEEDADVPSPKESRCKAPPAPVIVKVDEEGILQKLRGELDFDGIKAAFQKFSEEHSQAMSALDRKIDRDYVERLFDKFRVLISGLNDRVKELAQLNNDYATRDELQVLARIVRKLPGDPRPATALKKGCGCLFCGNPRSSLAGEISPRTAALAGKPAVGSVLNDGQRSEFIYGDGQAFKRGEDFQSFPHLATLPPLADAPSPL